MQTSTVKIPHNYGSTKEAKPLLAKDGAGRDVTSVHPDSIDVKVEDEDGIDFVDIDAFKLKKKVKLYVKYTYIVLPFYYAIALICAGALVIGLIGVVPQIEIVWVMIGLQLFGALFGAYAVFKFNSVFDQVQLLKSSVNGYQAEISMLEGKRQKVAKQVKKLDKSVGSLSRDTEELQSQMEGFKDLQDALRETCGDNEDIMEKAQALQDTMQHMERTAEASERAQLLSLFYEVSFRQPGKGTEPTMNRKEYQRFLGRVSKSHRNVFKRMVTFQDIAGDDDEISVAEFEGALENFLEFRKGDKKSKRFPFQ